MGTIQHKTRTNYFRVKDEAAFADLLNNMIIDSDSSRSGVILMKNNKGEVGFCADAVIYDIKPDICISDETIESFKKELFRRGLKDVEDFVGMTIGTWDKDAIKNAIDETIGRMPEKELKKYIGRYVDCTADMGDEMAKQIQALLEPGHACIITDIGYDGLRRLTGRSTVITPAGHPVVIDLNETAMSTARLMLHNEDYSPQTTY